VAVCLAAYNGVCWLPEQLESILLQKGVVITVFVSVDSSSDGTEDWFNHRALGEKRIVLLPHGERFGGAAKNFFRLLRDVNFSTFDYVSFADQDDIWYLDKLVRACEVMRQADADAYSSNVVAFWPAGREQLVAKAQPQRRWDFLFEAAGPGCTYVMKADLVRDMQVLVRSQWEALQEVGLHDWFSYAFARAKGYKWVIDDRPGMLYRQHATNQVGVNNGWRAFLYRSQKITSGWGLAQSEIIARLIGLADDPFVKAWINGGRLGVLRLAFFAQQCRRRARDQILFAVSCIVSSVLGRRNA
jgi:rhamnosyltransferase